MCTMCGVLLVNFSVMSTVPRVNLVATEVLEVSISFNLCVY